MKHRTCWLAPLALAAGIAACGEDSTPAPVSAPAVTALATASTATLAPADPELARLYAQTCKSCHATPGSGAPQTGDRKAWEPRLQQGMPVLREHTINGYKGMPPLGSCMDCGEAEFEALIKFMAGTGS